MVTQQFIDNKIKTIQYWLADTGYKISNLYKNGTFPSKEDSDTFVIMGIYNKILYSYNAPDYLFTVNTDSYGTTAAQLQLTYKNSTDGDYIKTYGDGVTTTWDVVMKQFEDSFYLDSNLSDLYGEAVEEVSGIYRFTVYNKEDNNFENIYITSITNGNAYGDRLPDVYTFTNVRAWKYDNYLTEDEITKIIAHVNDITNYKTKEL